MVIYRDNLQRNGSRTEVVYNIEQDDTPLRTFELVGARHGSGEQACTSVVHSVGG